MSRHGLRHLHCNSIEPPAHRRCAISRRFDRCPDQTAAGTRNVHLLRGIVVLRDLGTGGDHGAGELGQLVEAGGRDLEALAFGDGVRGNRKWRGYDLHRRAGAIIGLPSQSHFGDGRANSALAQSCSPVPSML
jgi:hypothetical protein